MNGNLFDSSAEPTGWYTAWCDGGSRGNPGPAGYGAVIQNPSGETVARLSRFLGKQTNNFAEYQGLLAVLEWSVQNGAKHLRVISDSELMVNQMKGRYKVASPTLRPLFEQARRLSKSLEKFEMQHTLRGGNKEADRLANEAMDKGRSGVGGASGVSGASTPGHQQASGTASQQVGGAARSSKRPRQVLEGFVKNGVVHLIEGELPDGIIVKIIRE
jgi:ribonuclease HI